MRILGGRLKARKRAHEGLKACPMGRVGTQGICTQLHWYACQTKRNRMHMQTELARVRILAPASLAGATGPCMAIALHVVAEMPAGSKSTACAAVKINDAPPPALQAWR